MKIEHVAIWAWELEQMKEFYCTYFEMKAGKKYVNKRKQFESYFLTSEEGARLELMYLPEISPGKPHASIQKLGLAHLAISVGDKKRVIGLTNQLRTDGYQIVSEPRLTGDGYFESCVLDPENNRIEITI